MTFTVYSWHGTILIFKVGFLLFKGRLIRRNILKINLKINPGQFYDFPAGAGPGQKVASPVGARAGAPVDP